MGKTQCALWAGDMGGVLTACRIAGAPGAARAEARAVAGGWQWGGAAAVLKAKPTRVRTTPVWARVTSWPSTSWTRSARRVRWRVPVAAERKLAPIRLTAVAVTDDRKNFRAASEDLRSPCRRPTSATAGRDAAARAASSGA